MSDLLQEAFDKASALSADEQEGFARFLLAELESRQYWMELFSRPKSEEFLDQLADEALSDHRAGRTQPLDPGCT